MNTFQVTYRGQTSKEFFLADCKTVEQAEQKLKKELPANARISLLRTDKDEAFFNFHGVVGVPAESEAQAWLKTVAALPFGATVEIGSKKSFLQVLQ